MQRFKLSITSKRGIGLEEFLEPANLGVQGVLLQTSSRIHPEPAQLVQAQRRRSGEGEVCSFGEVSSGEVGRHQRQPDALRCNIYNIYTNHADWDSRGRRSMPSSQ